VEWQGKGGIGATPRLPASGGGLFAHRDEFSGGARMDVDGLVELPLGGAAFDRDRRIC